MAEFRHGIYSQELATSVVSTTPVDASLPVVFGTAPLHLATEPAEVNKPILCSSYQEAVKMLGYSDDWDKYTLCEFMNSHFSLFQMSPVVFINVLDLTKHKQTVSSKEISMTNNTVTIADDVILSSLVVKKADAGEPLILNTDYIAEHDDDGNVVITAIEESEIYDAESIWVEYDRVDASMVETDDIVGGVDINTGALTGLEVINIVYSKLGMVPGIILAPKWSEDITVASVIKAKEDNIGGLFLAIGLVDIPTGEGGVKKYSDISSYKTTKNLVDEKTVVCWPKVALAGKQYHLSTQLAGVIAQTDSENSDIPYVSPSNKNLQCDSTVLEDGTEVSLDFTAANIVNGVGAVTAINFTNGWVVWGNRTSIYPSSTDVKDCFIPVRRMFNWIINTMITTYWSKIDDPTNTVFIKTIVNSVNIWLNSLVSRGFLIGASCQFRQEDNPVTDLLDGTVRFYIDLASPIPAEKIEFIYAYNVEYLNNLFSE